jgi:hypothetical protein
LGLWSAILRKIFTIISLGFFNIPRTGKLKFLRVCCSTDQDYS